MPGLAGLSCRSKAVVLTVFCSSPVSRARLSENVSAITNRIQSTAPGVFYQTTCKTPEARAYAPGELEVELVNLLLPFGTCFVQDRLDLLVLQLQLRPRVAVCQTLHAVERAAGLQPCVLS